MTTPYAPPEWGENGANAFGIYLDVVRNGMLVETLALPLDAAKSFVVAGRMEPLCDLVLQHPSISRVHAVLQFDAHGALFVQDMKSTHGTFVNKKRLAPLAFQRLHVGDLLVFGESTRKYAVCGPEELLPEEPDREKLRARIEAKKVAQRKREEQEASGASWGFREDAEEDDDEEEDSSDDDEASGAQKKKRRGGGTEEDEDLPEYLRGIKELGRSAYETSVKAADVSEKDQKLFTQLQNKISKMENLETEKARILAKQNELQGLSEGQQNTLSRNSARIESLRKEIEELEDRIHARNAQRDQSRAANDARAKARGADKLRRQNAAAAYAYDSDEDDFYDRTRANKQKLSERKRQLEASGGTAAAEVKKSQAKSQTEVLTAEIIQRKIKMLESDLAELRVEYERVAAEEEEGGGGGDDGEEVDALEAFMRSTATELHAKELARVRTRKEEVERELKKQRQLLAIAMPALSHETAAATAAPAASSVLQAKPVQAEPIANAVEETTKEHERCSIAQPIVAEEAMEKPEDPRPTASNEQRRESSPATSRATKQEPLETNTQRPVDATDEEPPKPKKRRLMGPTLPPPSMAATSSRPSDATELEGGDRVWVPPANQTGDGRTQLNAKYGY